jgi:hypothetical protein
VGLLENFYEDAYASVRAHLPLATIYIGDGFNSRNFNNFWTGQPQASDARQGWARAASSYHASYPVVADGETSGGDAIDGDGSGGGGGGGDGDDAQAAAAEAGDPSDASANPRSDPPAYVVGTGIGESPGSSAPGVALAARAAFWDVRGVALDTHMYQCFTRAMRRFSPRQHVAEACGGDRAWLERCCHGKNGTGSGLARVVGEWTAAYDQVKRGGMEGV